MRKTELEGPELQQADQKLLVYSALDKRERLKAFFLIRDTPGIAFSEIVKGVKAKKALMAYHLGILKASALVTFTYERKGNASYSTYNLTKLGKKVAKELAAAIK